MSKVVLFGAGKIAQVAYYHLRNDSPHEVVAFAVDGQFLTTSELLGLPVVAAEELPARFPPGDFAMLVAVGYQKLNELRAAKCREFKEQGYELISYLSSRASNVADAQIGENCLILENQTIQPGATIGHNVTLWSGNHIGHHSTVADHCFITSGVVISGGTVIEPYCFIGVNVSIGHGITIGSRSILGAGSLVTKSTAPKSVYITRDTEPYRLDSDRFMRLSGLGGEDG